MSVNKLQEIVWTSLESQIKNLPAMQKTQVQFLGLEDPLENEMATHSSILDWIIPWTEKPGRLQPVHMYTSVVSNSLQRLGL